MNDIYLNNTDLSLQFSNGDFLVDNTDNQNLELIIKAMPGQFYQWPTLGVGIGKYDHAPFDYVNIKKVIQTQITDDFYSINILNIDSNADGLIIDLNATKL